MEAVWTIDMCTGCYGQLPGGTPEGRQIDEGMLDKAVMRILRLKNKLAYLKILTAEPMKRKKSVFSSVKKTAGWPEKRQ